MVDAARQPLRGEGMTESTTQSSGPGREASTDGAPVQDDAVAQADTGQDQAAAPVDRVELRLPADSAYLGVLRTATAALAARRDFTVDEIEDLRIAVDEMSTLLLTQVRAGASLDCVFEVGRDDLTIHVSAESDHPKAPHQDSLAWTLLTALTGELNAAVTDTTLTISLHKRRAAV
jgi:serine/threonine-protein kinase RsbW